MIKRIIADAILFLSLFFAPWYATVGLAILFIILFRYFWEAAVAGIFIDSLYSISGNGLYANFGTFTISSIILIIIAEEIKKQIRI